MDLKKYSKYTINFILASACFSCSDPSLMTKSPNIVKKSVTTNNSFNTKYEKDLVEGDWGRVFFQPYWTNIYDGNASGSVYSQDSLLENENQSLNYQPNPWNLVNDNNASGGSYAVISGQNGIALLSDNDPINNALLYSDAYTNWVHHTINPNSMSYNEGQPLKINSNHSLSKKYGDGWKSKDDECSYNKNQNGTYLEISFYGTNIELWGNQDRDYGKLKITVFDSNNNIEKVINDIDRYSNKEKKSIIAKIQGLKTGKHKVRIESIKTKNSYSKGYGYDFSYGIVYPSVEYTFSGKELKYYAFTANTYGKVDIILDGGTPERLDLYSNNNPKYIGCSKDKDNGHGNDYDDCDRSNPGKSKPDCERDSKSFNSKSNNNSKKDKDDDVKIKPKVCKETENTQVEPISTLIKEYSNLSDTEHRIIIEATNEKNNLSKGYTINLDKFEKNAVSSTPTLEGTFLYTKYENNSTSLIADPTDVKFLNENNLDIKVIKGPNLGLVDLYIDENYNQTIDLYNPTIKYETISIDIRTLGSFSLLSIDPTKDIKNYSNDNLEDENLYHFSVNTFGGGSDCYDVYSCPSPSTTQHTFKLVAKNEKNPLSSGMGITFDSIDFSRATYLFSGTGIDYIATKKSDQGIAELYVDNKLYGTYDLFSSEDSYQNIIISIKNLPRDNHKIILKPTGRKNPSSTGYSVNLDAFKVFVSTQLKGQIGKD
jgi:hypothetical protein